MVSDTRGPFGAEGAKSTSALELGVPPLGTRSVEDTLFTLPGATPISANLSRKVAPEFSASSVCATRSLVRTKCRLECYFTPACRRPGFALTAVKQISVDAEPVFG
jgi:hypothetical protein